MNSFKMAFRNIRKSGKDYSVYFLTLIIGVAVFYMFNSVGSQNFMKTIVESRNEALQNLVRIMNIISVGVAVILGVLMVYANNFLIKRRKKEFGVYLMLGMNRRKVAGILSLETLMVGIISLVAGLVAGIIGSQFLSVIVGRLFEADLSSYAFSFSFKVCLKTAIYFMILFLVVLIFNVRNFRKYQLIDLLNAKKSNEKKLIANPKLSVVFFILSLAALTFAYYEIGFKGRTQTKGEFVAAVLAGFVGNFGFFFSLAGFLPEVIKKFKGLYFKGLNAFITTQFSSNINSSAFSFSVIAIMLFLAVSAFSVGFSMNGYLNARMKNSTPVDVSAESLAGHVSDILISNGKNPDDLMNEYVEMPIYYSKYIVLETTIAKVIDEAKATFPYAQWGSFENIVKLSDYNKLEDLYGRDHINLEDDEYAVICDFDLLTELTDKAIESGNTITVGDRILTCGYNKCIEEYVLMSGMEAAMGVVIVPDAVIDAYADDFEAVGSVFSGNYRNGDSTNGDAAFEEVFATIDDTEFIAQFSTKTAIEEECVNTSVTVVFIVLYIGIVFIITSAAVIAIKILSDSMDDIDKYETLMLVGADSGLRKKALFIQTLLNFALPFILGFVHSVFALKYARELLRAFGMVRMFGGTLSAVAVMLLVYGGYFIITFEACKKNILKRI